MNIDVLMHAVLPRCDRVEVRWKAMPGTEQMGFVVRAYKGTDYWEIGHPLWDVVWDRFVLATLERR